MMRKLIFLFVLFLSAGTMIKAANVVFKASAPQAVVMGEKFQIIFTVNADGKELRAPEFPDFNVLMGPNSSVAYSSSWSNGKSTSETTITYTYVLMPKKEGTFNIAAATIKVGGSNYTSNTLSIKVLPPDKKSAAQADDESSSGIGKDDFFVKMDVSSRNVYEQQGFLVTFKLFAARPCTLVNYKFPEFEGFLAQEVELPQQKQWGMDNYNGRNYYTVVLKQTNLYPQRSGKITIESGRFDAEIEVRSAQKIRSIFEEFLDATHTVSKQLLTNPVTINVNPLPSGKPANFSGAVGNFSMTSEMTPSKVKANEAVTIKVRIAGNGNVKLLKKPEVTFPNDFDVYDPKEKSDLKTTTSGVSGSKTIEYIAIPRYAGEFDIPPVSFSYFDTKTKAYKTLTSQPYKLQVDKGDGTAADTAPVISNFTNKETVKYLGKDIRYLKMDNARFLSNNDIFFGSFLYSICYLVPGILFILFFIVYRKQVKENSNLALVRTKKANKTAVRRLKNAGKLMGENNKEAFYEEVLRALWGYLSDKLNISQSNLTKDNVETELSKYGVDELLISEFMDILNTCEFARYAPTESPDAMDKLYELTAHAIGNMENTIKK